MAERGKTSDDEITNDMDKMKIDESSKVKSGGMTDSASEDDIISQTEKLSTDDKKDEAFRWIFNTVLSKNWIFVRKTYLVYTLNDKEPLIIENDGESGEKKHAEILLLKRLERKKVELAKIKVKQMTVYVTVYMNNSPCSDCSSELLKFLQTSENDNWRICLYVAHLYKIPKSKTEVENLKDLRSHAQCEIKSFNKDVWERLKDILGTGEELIMNYEKKQTDDDRSRKDQDEAMRDKLEKYL